MVKGKVADKQNGLPIEFASISLLQEKDSTTVTGSLTSNDGAFTLQKIQQGKYILQIFCI
jgi:hypothetical protein